jgi:hypothetical protein
MGFGVSDKVGSVGCVSKVHELGALTASKVGTAGSLKDGSFGAIAGVNE